MRIIVAGSGVDVGKTVTAAILAAMLKADYWKPVSCAPAPQSDRAVVQRLLEGRGLRCHPESYSFDDPVSPHAAAARVHVAIDAARIAPPPALRLIIETVGGVAVPLNDRLLTVDLFRRWPAHWVLVSHNHLGSISQTLLTIEALRRRAIAPLGIIFNGPPTPSSEEAIVVHSGLPTIGRILPEETINASTIQKYGELWKSESPWNALLS